MIVGILALQGDYQKHKIILDNIDVKSILVRNSLDLKKCNALIIPGGESTTISKQIDSNRLRDKLQLFAKNKPILGTCAGMIILSNSNPEENMRPLNIMNFQINRNAWGRQINSFSARINLSFDMNKAFHAVFIRAPKVTHYDENLEVLAFYNNNPILLTDGMHLVSSFHPEIGHDFRLHQYFIKRINEKIPALS